MIVFGILFCIISLLILYKRFILIYFGESAIGVIIGYGDCIKGTRGINSYNYKVKYKYKNNEYIAQSLESVSVFNNDIPRKNIHQQVTIYFRKNNPEMVTIKEIKQPTRIAFIFLILGIILILFSMS